MYACIDLDGASSQFIYRPLGYGDDPLLQRQSVGFRFAEAQRINTILNVRFKPTLIDMEARQGDMAQAQAA